MSFDSSAITEVTYSVSGGQLLLEWSSTAVAGSFYQVYLQGELAWTGQALHASVAMPRGGVNRVDVGAVGAKERDQDFSSSITVPHNRAKIAWTAADANAKGFNVYGESEPGGGIDYASPLATVAAGATVGSYSWTSGPLTTGTWHYGVKPYDAAGNEGTAATTTVAIAVPPRPPAQDARGKRLTSTYDFATKKLTLNWLASPTT